jgi:pimeloyl-ACP methyl ester carboxylesterase
MAFHREPIHLGSGEPILLLHPFLCSQAVWSTVAPQLADTGRFEVFAPTMVGHHGGTPASTWRLDTHAFADDIERRLDALGWETAHIVGNSLGGWVSFELERRGRARSITAIAPGGGWTRYSPVKFEVVGKFVAGAPVLIAARLIGPKILRLPLARRIATWPVSGPADGPSDADLQTLVQDATHSAAYPRLLIKTLTAPGLMDLQHAEVPVHLITCERDRVVPHPRFSRHFARHLPPTSRISRLDGVGHIPMLEAPDRITRLIADFVDEHTYARRAVPPAS